MNEEKKRNGIAALRKNKRTQKMSEYYRNELGTRIEIVAQKGKWLWVESVMKDGTRDRGRIKTTDKFQLVNDGTWTPVITGER